MTAEEARRQYAAAYMRNYRKNNKEKTAEINRRYWEKRAAKLSAEQEQKNWEVLGNGADHTDRNQ